MSRQKLKHRARTIMLTHRRPHVLLVSLLYVLVGMLLMQIILNLSDVGQFQIALAQQTEEALERFNRLGVMEVLTLPTFRITILGTVFFVASWVFTWMMDLGYFYYAKGTAQGETLGYQSLLEGFNYFVKGVLIRLIRVIVVTLGLLLFILPGIFLRAAFSQVEPLLLDHPKKSVFWVFRESWRLMRGRIWEYLLLRLSFFGWIVLRGMVAMFLPPFSYIVQLWLTPYLTLTRVNYYHALTGQEPPEPEPDWQRPGL